ncbi:MAG: uracil-DNA glycosylase [Acidobacteriota bacterium]
MSRRDLLTYLADFGWHDLEAGAPAAEASQCPAPAPPKSETPAASSDLAALSSALQGCQRCRLHQGRRHVVFGVGNSHARVMLVGEAPGAEEDRLGEPFVGSAGQLLNSMLRAIGLRREEVYIANIVKCRPPGNREPQDDEAATRMPFLWRQLELVNPQVIVTLGRVAAHHLLGTSAPISTYRGKWLAFRGWPVLPTFHPAYLLRTPTAKAQAWADLKQLRRRMAE